MQRRAFLLGATAAAAIAGGTGYLRARIVETPAQVRYPGMQAGHALRDGAALPEPTDARLRRGDPGFRRRRPVLRLETGARGPCRFRRGGGAGIRRQRRRRRTGRPGLSDGRALPAPALARIDPRARDAGRLRPDRARRRRRHALLRRNRAGPFAAGTTAARWPLGRQPAADAGPARGRPGAAPPLPGPGAGPAYAARQRRTQGLRHPADPVLARSGLDRAGRHHLQAMAGTRGLYLASPALVSGLLLPRRLRRGHRRRVGLGRTALLRRARRPCRQRRRGRGADLAGRPVDTGGAHARGDQRQAGP